MIVDGSLIALVLGGHAPNSPSEISEIYNRYVADFVETGLIEFIDLQLFCWYFNELIEFINH